MSHLKSCHCCGLVQTAPEGVRAVCVRCATALGSWLGQTPGNSLSAAFALAALSLYIPAMALPFLRIERLGHAHASTLVGGVWSLLAEGHRVIGGVVLLFSIVLPVCKLTALLVLAQRRWRLAHRNRAMVYRWVEHLGRWGMLDVLLVAVMIAFVKLGGLVQFTAGPGLVVFAAFVVLSLCASAAFDPYALWDEGLTLASVPNSGSSAGAVGAAAGVVVAVEGVPQAVVPPAGPGRWWVWLIPLAVGGLAGTMLWNAYADRGRVIKISFHDGHGIAAGADLRYHGINCGEVEAARLSHDMSQIELDVRLTPAADGLAREGARFWIVRPRADLTGIAGLETVVGAKYITLLPGDAAGNVATQFIGLDDPPVPDLEEPGGIELVLQSPYGAGLRPGVGVHYRDLRVGGIVSTGLAGDGSAIETRIYIRPQFRHLAREQAIFWNASGVHLQGGLTEFALHIGTAETLLRGGIAMSLPPDPGAPVAAGRRFVLHPRPKSEWLEWQPSVSGTRPATNRPLPVLLPATLRWTHDGLLFDRPHERTGWLLANGSGVSGPSDLLSVPVDALNGRAVLTVAGQDVELKPTEGETSESPLSSIELEVTAELPAAAPPQRVSEAPEDMFLSTDTATAPLFIAAVRCRREGPAWIVEATLPIAAELHGAAAVAASDGALLGRLLCVEEDRYIVPFQPTE